MDVWQFHLHWGWNPVVFFIILVTAFVLVIVAKKQVLWLVPALVMYAGLDWALPWSWLFKLIFWVAVVVVLVTAVLPRLTRGARFPLAWMSALVAVILVLGGINWTLDAVTGDGQPPSAEPSTTPSSTPTPTTSPSPTETAAPTPEGLDEAKLAKLFAKEFRKRHFKAGEVKVGKVDWSKNPVDHRGGAVGKQVKTQAGLTRFVHENSPEARATRKHVLAVVPVAERQRVLDGNNYIPIQFMTGIQYGGNTYWKDGELVRGNKVVAKSGDIWWVFVGSDYKIYWDAAIRADCHNVGLKTPPRPHRPPPPPPLPYCVTHDCTQPTPKCPSGQVGTPPNCLTPKSDDPADYTYPEGKPKVKVTTPAESTPPKVETHHTGGGQVVDTPTKSPGSETGGQAPGADEPRETEPTQPPEGGDEAGNNTNDGTVTMP